VVDTFLALCTLRTRQGAYEKTARPPLVPFHDVTLLAPLRGFRWPDLATIRRRVSLRLTETIYLELLTWEIQCYRREGKGQDEDRLADLFGLLLIALSALLYLVHFYLFHNLAYIEIYGLGDVAFLPIEVLLVVLVVDWIISRQEKRSQLAKLNMVIGVYFSEVGTPLLKAFRTLTHS